MLSKSRIAKLQQLLYDMAVLVFHSDMEILLFHQQHKHTGDTYGHPLGGSQLRRSHPMYHGIFICGVIILMRRRKWMTF